MIQLCLEFVVIDPILAIITPDMMPGPGWLEALCGKGLVTGNLSSIIIASYRLFL